VTRRRLILRTIRYFRWSNLAVCAGIIVATAVLTGALMVGDSVRGSLRDLTIERLGPVDDELSAGRFFPQSLANRIDAADGFRANFEQIHPAVILHGSAGASDQSIRTADVQIGAIDGPWVPVAGGNCIVNGQIAESLPDLHAGESLLLSLPMPSGSPLDAALSRRSREDVTANLRATCQAIDSTPDFASMFSLFASQRPPRNCWVNLADLQSAIGQENRANVLLVQAKPRATSDHLQEILRQVMTLSDYGINAVKSPAANQRVINSSDTYFLPPIVQAAKAAAKQVDCPLSEVSSYLVNTAAVVGEGGGGGVIHYAMIAGLSSLDAQAIGDDQIVLNQWAADHLHAKIGDRIVFQYYFRQPNGDTKEVSSTDAGTKLRVSQILPMSGPGADSSLTPAYKGLTDSDSVSDWHAPAGITIRKDWIGKDDEAYWKRYRAAPKLLVSLNTAKRLWNGPFGLITSLRIPAAKSEAFTAAFARQIDPATMGFVFRPIRQQQLDATSGSSDFAGLFMGFSFFLIVAAVMLTAMLMRLNIEQRARQLGLLAAIGFPAKSLRRMALTEGMLLAILGAAVGVAVAVGYTALMMLGLRTWWIGAIGTTAMRLHVVPITLLYGFVGSVVVAYLAILWSVWRVGRKSAATLLAGGWGQQIISHRRRKWVARAGWLAVLLGVGLLLCSAARVIAPAEAFLSGGTVLLFAFLMLISAAMQPRRQAAHPQRTIPGIGFRNMSRNLVRSVVTMGLIALASFALVTVAAMRGSGGQNIAERTSGAGGFRLMLPADIPLTGDLSSSQGRDALAIADTHNPLWSMAHFVSMRRWRGEDISCLNLMKPTSPTILSVPPSFADRNAFSFVRTLDKTDASWGLLLPGNGAGPNEIPVIADDETAQYILHLGLGQSLTITDQTGVSRKLVLVATLATSIFQGELLMGEANFQRLFPAQSGASVVLVDIDPADAPAMARLLSSELSDFSVTIDQTADVLAAYQNVQNTYLATFQVLGALGLLLGTIGLAVVLLRSVVERRAELAMLAAIGFRRIDRLRMLLIENGVLLLLGLGVGTVCAIIAMLPTLIQTARHVHIWELLVALGFILLAGMAALVTAVWCSSRSITPADLRSE
jgi:ABC-type antimicrobial peptide transport system permease subunit